MGPVRRAGWVWAENCAPAAKTARAECTCAGATHGHFTHVLGCGGFLVPVHDSDTGDVARGQHWSIMCTYRVCNAEFSVLGPKCPVGEAKPRQNTRNPQLALQGPFGTAEGCKTMTATPETSLEVNTGP